MDLNSLIKINFLDIDNEVLCDIENIISNDWDIVKKDETCFKHGEEVTTENVHIDIKEKTIELGAAHNDKEMVIETFTFNIEGSVVKAYKLSLFDKYDPNEETDVKISPKNHKLEINMDLVEEKCSETKKDEWWWDIQQYAYSHMTEKNKERFEEKMNRIQGPTFKALINGIWKPDEERTEPNFSVTVADLVAFGDFCDAKKRTLSTVTPAPGSTIRFNINTVRSFSPGVYKLSVIRVEENCTPFVIFHHELVSPRKIVTNLLLTPDLSEYTPNVTNSLNRYDWCHAMHWGAEDLNSNNGFINDEEGFMDEDFDVEEKERNERLKNNSLFRQSKMGIIYFTPVLESEFFEVGVKKGFQKESAYISGSHQIFGSTMIKKDEQKEGAELFEQRFDASNNTFEDKALDEYQKVSIGINMRILEPHFEWLYGAVFEDDETHLNFALAVFPEIGFMKHFEIGVPEAFKKDVFLKREKKFMFKMKDFY